VEEQDAVNVSPDFPLIAMKHGDSLFVEVTSLIANVKGIGEQTFRPEDAPEGVPQFIIDAFGQISQVVIIKVVRMLENVQRATGEIPPDAGMAFIEVDI